MNVTGLRLAANLSMLYAELPVGDRPAAAVRDGFKNVESWWPFNPGRVTPEDIDGFCRSIESAGARLIALNLDEGDMPFGERGLVSDPERELRLDASIEVVLRIAERTGCGIVNALYGNRSPHLSAPTQDGVGIERLARLADRASEVGATIVLETLNSQDSPRYPLVDPRMTAQVVLEAQQQSNADNLGLLLDTYHLATMGYDPAATLRQFSDLVRHVQFADAPGRGRPGTGNVDFLAIELALAEIDYDGYVALEYDPARELQLVESREESEQ